MIFILLSMLTAGLIAGAMVWYHEYINDEN